MSRHHTAFEPMIKAMTVETLKSLKSGRGAGLLTLISVKQIIAEHEDDVFAAARSELDEELHRWFLWEACIHEGKYGDDGEMQCGGVDFKRDQLWALQQHVQSAIDEKDKDLHDLRAQRIHMSIQIAELQDQQAQASKRIEVLEDLLQDIYRGDLGYRNPRDPEIQRIRKELGLV